MRIEVLDLAQPGSAYPPVKLSVRVRLNTEFTWILKYSHRMIAWEALLRQTSKPGYHIIFVLPYLNKHNRTVQRRTFFEVVCSL
jgi:hypothetical protein